MSYIGSPPRSSFGQRKPSIVERASNAIEQKLGGTALRRVATTPASYGSGGLKDVQSASVGSLVEENYSMCVDDYEVGEPIGYGSSAVVYIARYKPTNKAVGIKMIDLDMFERNQIDELRREIQIMSLSKHPNLLPVFGSFVHGSKLYIVTPFLSAGSCLDIMKTAFQDGMDEVSIATILKQALEGLVYLHKNGLIHRDVKAGNLLIHEDGLVQLADFGVSSSLMDTGERKGLRKTFVGTPCWMAPEVMEQSGYDYKADIWSFGITALELATGHAPFAKFPPIKVLMLTLQNDPPTLDRDSTKHRYSKTFKEMIDLCLVKDPAKRPTAEKLLSHPFFKQAAKKRQYLVVSLLQNLPPITQRQHNRRGSHPQKDGSYSKGVSWDFSTAAEELGMQPGKEGSKDAMIRTFLSESSVDSTTSSDSLNIEEGTSNGSGRERGVSFAPSVAVVGGGAEPLAAPAVKKSRFIVDSPSGASYPTLAVDVTSAPGTPTGAQTPVENAVVDSSSTPSSQTPPSSNVSPVAGEVRKGRFSVNQSAPSGINPSAPSVLPDTSRQVGSPADAVAPKLSDDGSTVERKPSRFAVQTLSTTSSSPATPSAGSQDSITTRTLDRRGRFEVTTGDNSPIPQAITLDQLIRQNELQRNLLNDMIAALGRNGLTLEALGVSVPAGVFEVNTPGEKPSPSLGPTRSLSGASMDGFGLDKAQPSADSLKRENDQLRQEVAQLRREVELFRKGDAHVKGVSSGVDGI
ncbi:STE/STE20/FRAY protein kinase [Spizellomyces punctatus DAOM BR117]|uniref:STE/STE20/FRAY protein kinase n=1 Tax=Spizellomyces punctatus (strain DAOM BR117) TaxID=645134 RepID=A0A0L0HS44_SPIPD|nr:STE/STE20/FRAY protein kinase [Spizellomyces punctatus DAOM BR117]KND03943.1 STE/STE20/FRAY protein kinase [Spizellomyces punctatus DAOM BR117]|eukprot:XP_016611982.1 STE/STE20/FRAY protein kinase [Spizellomyces punctatus DAOM BR117]